LIVNNELKIHQNFNILESYIINNVDELKELINKNYSPIRMKIETENKRFKFNK